MKKILIIGIGTILLIAIILGIVFLVPAKETPEDTVDFSNIDTKEFFKELDEKEIEYIETGEGFYVIPEQVVLNSKTDVYVETKKNEIVEMRTRYLLFSNMDYSNDFGAVQKDESIGADSIEDEVETEESNNDTVKEYKYSSKEKKKIKNAINDLKKSFEEKVGCDELTNYSLTPFVETEGMEIPEDDLDKVLKGYYQMEYSVRDENGRLWFIWIYSPYTGIVEATVSMVNSADKYQDFEPIINMQQQSNTQTEGE